MRRDSTANSIRVAHVAAAWLGGYRRVELMTRGTYLLFEEHAGPQQPQYYSETAAQLPDNIKNNVSKLQLNGGNIIHIYIAIIYICIYIHVCVRYNII